MGEFNFPISSNWWWDTLYYGKKKGYLDSWLFWDAFKVGNECTITARGKSTEASTTRSPLWRQTFLEGKPVCGRNKWKGRQSRANSGLEERLWLNACGQICQQVGYFMIIIITLIVLFKINEAKQN